MHDAERSRAESKTHIHMMHKGITAEQRTQRTLSELSANSQRTLSGLSASADTLLLSLYIQRKPRRNQTAAQSFIYASDRLHGMESGFYKPVAEAPTAKPNATERKLDSAENVRITSDDHGKATAEKSAEVRLLEKSQCFPNVSPYFSQSFAIDFSVISAERRIRNAEKFKLTTVKKTQVDHLSKIFRRFFKNSS